MSSAAPRPVLLLCGDLAGPDTGLDVGLVIAALASQYPNLEARVVPDLCGAVIAGGKGLPHPPARPVLGVCSDDLLSPKVALRLSDDGFEPLLLTSLDLAAACDRLPPAQAVETAALLSSAAVARAAAEPHDPPTRSKMRIRRQAGIQGRRSLFTLPPLVEQPVAAVDPTDCLHSYGCRVCIPACPADALSGTEDGLVVSAESCTGCGICVTACPFEALGIAGLTPGQLAAEVGALLEPTAESGTSRAIVYVPPSGSEALERLRISALGKPLTYLPVRVPCSSIVTAEWLLAPLAAGAVAVRVVSCGPECEHRCGESAAEAVAFARELVAGIGAPPSAVGLLPPAGELPAGALDTPDPAASQPQAAEDGPRESAAEFDISAAHRSATAIRSLPALGESAFRLEHEASPLGDVLIDPKTCTGCANCTRVCPTHALRWEEDPSRVAISFEHGLCVNCDICVELCPEKTSGAIEVIPAVDTAALTDSPRILYEQEQARCERCGEPMGSVALIRKIEASLRENKNIDDRTIAMVTKRCARCSGAGPLDPPDAPGNKGPLIF